MSAKKKLRNLQPKHSLDEERVRERTCFLQFPFAFTFLSSFMYAVICSLKTGLSVEGVLFFFYQILRKFQIHKSTDGFRIIRLNISIVFFVIIIFFLS